MAIKAGQILHDARGFVIDRIQTGGVNNLNIPQEKIYELGNYQTVATVRDIPDLSFEVQSLDVSTEIEALALHIDPTTVMDGDELDFTKAVPLDIISPFKAGNGLYNIISGIALPYLTLENVTYRYGLRANAEETFTFRGDSIYYIPGSPYYEEHAKGSGTYSFAHTAIVYHEAGSAIYALGVCWYDPVSGTYKRLFHGTDFTDTNAGFTIDAGVLATIPSTAVVGVVYGSAVAATYNQSVHQDATVKPAAIRGKDIDVFVALPGVDSADMTRWTGVQSFETTRRVTLDNDEEFGNYHYVSQDYDVADVTGTITVRARDVADLFAKIAEVTDTPTNEVAGALSSQPLQVEARIYDPNSATPQTLKTLYIEDARFTPPATQGRVQQKLESPFPFTSDSGSLKVYKGNRA